MRLYKLLFWVCLVFILTIWDAITFILALVNRSKSQDACDEANPDQGEGGGGDQSVSVAGYKTTFLGMQLGSTYGLANCAQAVQAGVIGLAILLFVGQIAMVMIIWGVEGNRGWLDLLTHNTHTRNSFTLPPSLDPIPRNSKNVLMVIGSMMMIGMTTWKDLVQLIVLMLRMPNAIG